MCPVLYLWQLRPALDIVAKELCLLIERLLILSLRVLIPYAEPELLQVNVPEQL